MEEEEQLLCYNEPTDKLDDENLRISSILSLFLACFRLGRHNEMGGHMGASKTYKVQNDFTTGRACLIGYVHLLLTASHARITNRNQNTGTK